MRKVAWTFKLKMRYGQQISQHSQNTRQLDHLGGKIIKCPRPVHLNVHAKNHFLETKNQRLGHGENKCPRLVFVIFWCAMLIQACKKTLFFSEKSKVLG